MDPDGLQVRPPIPGHRPPNNIKEAAGYHEKNGEFICLEWDCSGGSVACGPNWDYLKSRSPNAYIPAATDPRSPPDGCRCARRGYDIDLGPPTEGSGLDAANAAKDVRDANNMNRFEQFIRNGSGWYPFRLPGRF